jgi:hypothetical protein
MMLQETIDLQQQTGFILVARRAIEIATGLGFCAIRAHCDMVGL